MTDQVNPESEVDLVTVLTTGGTIDKVYFDAKSTFEVGESVVHELLRQAHVKVAFEIHELMRKDSLELTQSDREQILHAVQNSRSRAVVVTHGTDTMTDTAATLLSAREKEQAQENDKNAREMSVQDKTVVFTGALSPARFAQSDATFNVGMAFAAAQCLPPGVYIVMNGQVFAAGAVRKDVAANQFVPIS